MFDELLYSFAIKLLRLMRLHLRKVHEEVQPSSSLICLLLMFRSCRNMSASVSDLSPCIPMRTFIQAKELSMYAVDTRLAYAHGVAVSLSLSDHLQLCHCIHKYPACASGFLLQRLRSLTAT